ncbi:MAG: hypothetical protein NC820_00490 [Candidatus Omnitrophica bacterium]|nr:hypothetical protein [Candidatus Omnitrophota bacterium]
MYGLTLDKVRIIKNIRIVLVNPTIEENIGLCARVLKNTSFSHLYLVKPNLSTISFKVAKRANDLLKEAKVFDELKQALKDSLFVFGTTRRKRADKLIYNLNYILPSIVAQASKGVVSIIFGKEDFGLSKEELRYCDSVFYIPANPNFSSYNLAFAVGIVCYKILEYLDNVMYIDSLDLAKKEDIETLLVFIQKAMTVLGVKKEFIDSSFNSFRRIFLRTHLTCNEVQILKTIFLRIINYFSSEKR